MVKSPSVLNYNPPSRFPADFSRNDNEFEDTSLKNTLLWQLTSVTEWSDQLPFLSAGAAEYIGCELGCVTTDKNRPFGQLDIWQSNVFHFGVLQGLRLVTLREARLKKIPEENGPRHYTWRTDLNGCFTVTLMRYTFIFQEVWHYSSHRQVTAATTLDSNSNKTANPLKFLASQLEQDPFVLRPRLQAHSYKCSQCQVIKIHFCYMRSSFVFSHGTLERMWPFPGMLKYFGQRGTGERLNSAKPLGRQWDPLKSRTQGVEMAQISFADILVSNILAMKSFLGLI